MEQAIQHLYLSAHGLWFPITVSLCLFILALVLFKRLVFYLFNSGILPRLCFCAAMAYRIYHGISHLLSKKADVD
ncbi:hypothetical protein ACXKZH_06320 [Priestia megaterium]